MAKKMNALKAQWKVTAGIILGQPMDEYNKVFTYTGDMYEADRHNAVMIYHEKLDEVHDYAKILSNPGIVNWVNVEFIWI